MGVGALDGWRALARASLLVIGAGGALAADAGPAPSPSCTLEPGPRLAAVRVVDAETIELDDRSEVRLIGALAPRPPGGAATGAWPLEREAVTELERLVAGRAIELGYAGRRTDRYGRRLAHVFVEDGGERTWVQGHLLSQGLARAYALPGSAACLKEMLARERDARNAGKGLWASPAYAVRDTARPDLLLARRGRFEIVEGRVAAAADVRERLYLNFGADRRSDFTVAVPMALIRDKPETMSRLKALAGKRIRVRGWIERRNGPFIAISALAEIEVLDEGAQDSASPQR